MTCTAMYSRFSTKTLAESGSAANAVDIERPFKSYGSGRMALARPFGRDGKHRRKQRLDSNRPKSARKEARGRARCESRRFNRDDRSRESSVQQARRAIRVKRKRPAITPALPARGN